jgi:signal transduction histidine kinase
MPSGAEQHPTRPRFTLPAASVLRDRAEKMGEQLGRKGRPRRRFLNDQRARLARRLLPTVAIYAFVTGVTAVVDVFFRTPPVARTATLGQAFVTILLGGVALAVPIAKRSLVALRWLSIAAGLVLAIGWSGVTRATGGGASEYLLAAPLAIAGMFALLPLPPRIAIALGGAVYAGFVLGAPGAQPSVHVLVLSVWAAGYIIERRRHRAAILTFLRVERLSAKVSQLRRMQEQLVVVEKLEALRVLVGGMAHEMNNALTVAVVSTEQAKKYAEKDPAQSLGALKRAEGGLGRIRRSVDRLKRFAMSAEGTLEPADVGAMLDFALESAIGRARSGVIIDRAYDPEVGAIECHVAALAEALFQVARNAVEAMPGGGTIKASVRRDGERVVLTVADEGRGIPPEQLAKVFDPFYQGRPDAAKSGLGLSAVYGLVNALGGQVRIKSDVGRGTEVSIEMPAKRVRTTMPPPPVVA